MKHINLGFNDCIFSLNAKTLLINLHGILILSSFVCYFCIHMHECTYIQRKKCFLLQKAKLFGDDGNYNDFMISIMIYFKIFFADMDVFEMVRLF
jgi:hypothetical protein